MVIKLLQHKLELKIFKMNNYNNKKTMSKKLNERKRKYKYCILFYELQVKTWKFNTEPFFFEVKDRIFKNLLLKMTCHWSV